MRVAVNLSFLRPAVGGSYIYTLEILRELARRDDLEIVTFGQWPAGQASSPGSPAALGVDSLTVPGHRLVRRLGHQPGRLWVELIGARALDAVIHADVVWSPGNTAVALPRRSPARQLVTVHDLIHRSIDNPLSPFMTRRRDLAIRAAARRARRILVPSRFVADDLITHYGLAADQVVATGEGVDVDRRRACPIALPEDFVVCPATDHPHKNHRLLFRAAAAAGLNDGETMLVLTGVRYHGRHLRDLARDAGLRADRLIDLGHLGDHGYVLDVMARARAVALPSRYEGWGLPALEALALGRPTIAHGVGGVPEFAGPGLVQPELDSPSAWAAALAQVLHHPEALAAAATADAERLRRDYTWSAVTDRLLAAA